MKITVIIWYGLFSLQVNAKSKLSVYNTEKTAVGINMLLIVKQLYFFTSALVIKFVFETFKLCI